MIGGEVVTDNTVLIIGCSEQKIGGSQVAHRSLRVDVELAQRFDLIARKFQAHRQRRLPRIKIDNATAHGELSARRDLGNTFVTRGRELFEKMFHLSGGPAAKLNKSGLQRASLRRSLIEACARCDNQKRAGPTLDLH